MPVSSATTERSFIGMKRINNYYLRSIMGDDGLSSLALMHVHRSFDIDIEYAMCVFAGVKQRMVALY